ncbi:MAG TPA: hypothetical protein VFV75_04395 [Candidatus Polarisedimenticolaceae bacterium]|nr:hypothetical protein [Candidatus Polarisedimenticolaceae bacterium]
MKKTWILFALWACTAAAVRAQETPPSEEPPPAATGAAQGGTYFNPSIAVIGNFLGVAGNNDTENLPAASLRESEVSFQAVVDPYGRGDFFVSVGEDGAELEEGYLTFTALPWGLLAKVGRMRVPFGKINPLHPHVLPWPDEPLPLVNLLGGEEGWVGDGGSIGKLFALPGEIASEAMLAVYNGSSEGLFETPEGQREVAYLGRLRFFRDLVESTNLDLGLSYGGGPNGLTERSDTTLHGVDATLRWKPLRSATYRSAMLRAEAMWSRRDDGFTTQNANGWYVSGDYQFLKRWFAGARYERSDHPHDAALQDRGIAAVLTFWPSEFSQLRTEARRRSYANGETADEILFQIQFAIGAHGAHPF